MPQFWSSSIFHTQPSTPYYCSTSLELCSISIHSCQVTRSHRPCFAMPGHRMKAGAKSAQPPIQKINCQLTMKSWKRKGDNFELNIEHWIVTEWQQLKHSQFASDYDHWKCEKYQFKFCFQREIKTFHRDSTFNWNWSFVSIPPLMPQYLIGIGQGLVGIEASMMKSSVLVSSPATVPHSA